MSVPSGDSAKEDAGDHLFTSFVSILMSITLL